MAARASTPARQPAQQEITIRQVPAGKLELLDPAAIIPRNVRLQPDAEMVDSIRRRGQLEPVGVFKAPDGTLYLRYGDCRRLACIALERLVEAVVTEASEATIADMVSHVYDQLAENNDRKPLNAADRAHAVETLFEHGATAKAITEETGYSRAEITAARKAAKSETAQALAAQYPLDLSQAATVAEFDGDPATAEKLAKAAADNPGQFEHQVEQARQARADAAMIAARAAELTALGITVLPEDQSGYDNRIHYWADANEETLTAEAHKSCPGNAVYLSAWGGHDNRQVQEYWYCTDPARNGHRKLQNGKPEKTDEEAKAERRRIREGNDAWRAATAVRQRWIREVLLAQKTLPAGGWLFIARALAAAEHPLVNAVSTMSGGKHKTARELLGGFEQDTYDYKTRVTTSPLVSSLAGISEQRAQVITLALVIGAFEDQCADVETWKSMPPTAREYLTTLAGWGYTLSPVEQGVAGAS